MTNIVPVPKILATEYDGWPGGYQDSNPPDLTPQTAISGGQDVNFRSFPSCSLRSGTDFTTSKVIGDGVASMRVHYGANYNLDGTRKSFQVANGQVSSFPPGNGAMVFATNTLTATNVEIVSAVRPDSPFVYFTDGLSAVIKWDGAASGGDSTPASYKIGTTMCFWRGRAIVANLNSAGNFNIVWFSDEYADTFTSTNFAYVGSKPITALFVFNDVLYVCNSDEVYRITDLVFSASTGLTFDRVQRVASIDQGPINQGCVAQVGNVVMWSNSSGIYTFNGMMSQNVVRDKILGTWSSIDWLSAKTSLVACSALNRYYVSYPVGLLGAQKYNNRTIYFDPRLGAESSYSLATNGIFSAPYSFGSAGFSFVGPGEYSVGVGGTSATGELFYLDPTIVTWYQMERESTSASPLGYRISGLNSVYAHTLVTDGTETTDNHIMNAGASQMVAFPFTTGALAPRQLSIGCRVKLSAGTPGTLRFQIYSDSTNKPGSYTTGIQITPPASTGATYRTVGDIATASALAASTKYWAVLFFVGGDGTTDYAFAGVSGSGTMATYDGANWSTSSMTLLASLVLDSLPVPGYLETNAAQWGAPQFKKKMKRGFVRGQRVASVGNTTITVNLKYKDGNNGTYVTETLTDSATGSATSSNYAFEGYVKDRTKAKSIITRIDVTDTNSSSAAWQIDQLVNVATLLPRYR